MQTRSRALLLVAILCASCENDPDDSEVDSATPDAGLDAGDAGRDAALDAANDGALDARTDATLLDANLQPDAGDAAADASGWPPAMPTTFRIGVHGTRCYGDCPDYSLELDQAGKVTFFGGACAARPGAFTKQVAPADARMLYDGLAATQFWTLGERYVDMQDGCPMLWTDNRNISWNVAIDERSKMLVHYLGCKGLAELDRIDALETLAIQVSGVEPWLRPAPFNCGAGSRTPPYGFALEPAYRISQGAQVLGVLVLEADASRWTWNDCAGARLLQGDIIFEASRWSLLDPAKHPIQLPGGLGEVGSIVLDKPEGDAPPRVRALRANDELTLSATEANGC